MYSDFDGPATRLDQLYLTLRPEPLEGPEELRKYYREQINQVRGQDTVSRLAQKLQQSYQTLPFKAFLMGHRGVGKSTEVSRLLQRTRDQHIGVRLSIATELNPASFRIFDVLLLMVARLTEEADAMNAIPVLPVISTRGIENWFGTEQSKSTVATSTSAQAEAGAGIKGDSLWAGLLGLFASAKAETKYAADRKTETIDYRLQRLPDLLNLCNRVIEACSRALYEKTGKEWLLVVEDLDKAGISPQQLQDLFIQYGTVFQELRVSIIFTIPVWLAYSHESDRLPFERYLISDTPVFNRRHEPHAQGRLAIQSVLEARVSPSLFAHGQMIRLIVASGGNLRDLFALVLEAGEGALSGDPAGVVIRPEDAKASIGKMRRDYRMKLGQSPYDAQSIPYPEKAARLVAVYAGAPDSDVPDPVLYSLLLSRAIQQFNGEGWYGVHPLVVDLLKDQQHLKPQDAGGTT